MIGGTGSLLDTPELLKAEAWFRSQKPQDAFKMRPLSIWYVQSPSRAQMGQASNMCHRELVYDADAIFYGAGIDYLSQDCDKDKAHFWVDWMLGLESPWRILFKDGMRRVLDEDGETVGVILPASAVTYETFNIFKNFAIALRMPREYPMCFKTWHLFASMGLHKADALYLARCFQMDDRGNLSVLYTNCGNHWPLTDVIHIRHGGSMATAHDRMYTGTLVGFRAFDFERFRNGNPYDTDDWVNGCWSGDLQKRSLPIVWGYRSTTAPFTMEKTGFSTLKVYDPQAILNHFKEWQIAQGIKPSIGE